MLKWIGYLLLAALIVAIFTAPSEDKFKKFAYTKVNTSVCQPYIDYSAYKVIVTVFSIGHVKECVKTGIYDPQTGRTVGTAYFPMYGKTQTYLGLFGTFWKL
jgi:hypothetical protein